MNISQLVAIPHSGVYTPPSAPASIAANSDCASAISGISGVGSKPSSAGAVEPRALQPDTQSIVKVCRAQTRRPTAACIA